ncbi:outer membrane protein [Roseibium sp. RKSG952]|uniref:outer membrane protein n=1 Tax=Roseibium sp. RKSG952 TaxID=2529384 RepID=UPI0012BC9FF5|nr:outer membrane protein [Roseibium sp. RKSG952]MTH98139.1 porin family protein [Roseibium sp. RKSG952]
MKYGSIAGVAASALISSGGLFPALSADLPVIVDVEVIEEVTRIYDWSGFYVGGNSGIAWGTFNNFASGFGDFDRFQRSYVGGAHAGYNYMITPNAVAGLEADVQFSNLDSSRTINGVSVRSSSDWNASFRGRLGYAFDRFLLYGTGGVAIAGLEVAADGDKDSTTAVGWTLGGGLETAVTNNIVGRVEYLYQDFGRESFTLNDNRYSSQLDTSVVRFGLSYKF